MKVDKFILKVEDQTGQAGSKWLTAAFKQNSEREDDLDAILDATQATKKHAIQSGLFGKIDGSLKWEVPKEREVALGRWCSQLSARVPRSVKNALEPLCAKVQCKSRNLKKKQETLEDLLPSHLESVTVNMIAEKAKRSCSLQAAYDSANGTGLELSGFRPFIFGSDWIAQGALKLNPFRSKGPDLEVKLTQPMVVRKDDKAQLELFHVCAKRRRDTKQHLAHLVDSATSEASVTFDDITGEDSSAGLSVGVRHLNERQKIACWRALADVPGFNRWSIFGSSIRRYKYSDGSLTSKLQVDVPMTRDISGGVLELSATWQAREILNDFWRLTCDTGISTLWSRRGLRDIPLSRRLYLGGVANEIPLRAFAANQVGGLIAPSHTSYAQATATEHLGGAFRLGGSVEVSLIDPLRRLQVKSHFLSKVLSSARKVTPFAFADWGILLPQLPYNPLPLTESRLSAGVGASFPLAQLGRVKVTAGKAVRDHFGEAAPSCVNVSLVNTSD